MLGDDKLIIKANGRDKAATVFYYMIYLLF